MFEPSLVQYENPQIITHKSTKVALEANRLKAEKMVLMPIDQLITEGGSDGMDMLDVLMPPRIVEDSDKFWFQKVSRTPASASDLLHLQERLDDELIRQGALEIGLCDIRRNLYDQLFDELIRQEIVVCPERGRLLRMIRKETELSMISLLNCYESGLAYGIKKKLISSSETTQLTSQVTQMLSKIAELNDVIRDLEPQVAEAQKKSREKEAEKDEEFEAAEENIKKENKALLAQLRECIEISIELEN